MFVFYNDKAINLDNITYIDVNDHFLIFYSTTEYGSTSIDVSSYQVAKNMLDQITNAIFAKRSFVVLVKDNTEDSN